MFLTLMLLGQMLAVPAQEGFQCPEDITNPGGCIAGNYPNIYECTQYYQCDEVCTAFLRNCSLGLHFSRMLGVCDYPWTANCRPVTTTPAPGTEPPPTEPPTEPPPEPTTPPIEVTTPTPGPIPDTAVAFTAYLEAERYILLNPVYFDDVAPNLNQHFTDFNLFRVPQDAVYWFSLSAAALAGVGLDYVLVVSTMREASLKRGSTVHVGPDTTSRDHVRRLTYGQNVQVQSLSQGVYSDFELQTSFSAFSLTDMVGAGNEVVFMVARISSYFGYQSPLSFEATLINEGNAFDGTSNRFVAPSAGLYYFQISVGHNVASQLDYDLRRNGQPFVDLYRNSTGANGIDTTSRGIMVQLSKGDVMTIVNNAGSSIYSDNDLITSFSGFKYEVIRGQPVAWSVARTTSWTGESSSMYPVQYDQVLVNVGPSLPWNTADNRAEIPTTGYYFLHLSTGTMPGFGVNYSLTRNSAIFIDILRQSLHQNGHDVISRSAIAFFLEGDHLQVGAAQNTGMFSTEEMQTSLTGFLIYSMSP